MTADAIAIRATIDILEGNRNRALAKFAEAFDALHEAFSLASKAAPSATSGIYADDCERRALFSTYGESRDSWVESMRKRIDRSVWNHLLDYMGLAPLMDAQARKEFRDGLEKNPPEATAENCAATMGALIQDADLIFRRGLANAFSGLDRRFRSHDGFKVGARICLSHALRYYGGWNERQEATIRDVERVFHVLDGKEAPDYGGSVVTAIRQTQHGSGTKATTFENVYFKVRTFKNGNVHLWFRRDDLVLKVNRLLAEYYGETIGAGPDTPHKRKHEPNRTPAKHYGEYFSPPGIVEKVMIAASIERGQRVLEPSAGNGSIAKAAKAAGGDVHCVEIQRQHVTTLRDAGLFVHHEDFLDMTFLTPFDRIVMNPPFDRGRDVDHVSHALQFLKDGGVLVAVMSAGTEFRQDTKTVDFRDEVGRRGGKFHDLPPGSFSEVGTNVNTVLCVIGRGPYFHI